MFIGVGERAGEREQHRGIQSVCVTREKLKTESYCLMDGGGGDVCLLLDRERESATERYREY